MSVADMGDAVGQWHVPGEWTGMHRTDPTLHWRGQRHEWVGAVHRRLVVAEVDEAAVMVEGVARHGVLDPRHRYAVAVLALRP